MININEFLVNKPAQISSDKISVFLVEYNGKTYTGKYNKIEYKDSIMYELYPEINDLITELDKLLKSDNEYQDKVDDFFIDIEDKLTAKLEDLHFILFSILYDRLINKSFFNMSMMKNHNDIKIYFKIKNQKHTNPQELYILYA